ncbi:MAG TPA: cation diffusion facilitator family transporter [Bacteroidales bacterium]|nr:cation diffusion facilitator family transporter [Bacteroidales bacterium]
MNKKIRVARLSVFSNSLLIVLKVITGILSGSISILSEAIHSFMDLLAAIIAFFSVRISDTPADDRHPYGHGKFENISGVVEALLIFVAAFWIIFEAVKKLLHPKHIETIGIGFGVMLISAVVNFLVSRRLYKVAKETESIALEADALHLKTDVYTSAGVALGLGLIWITGYHLLDPVIAIAVALLILKESFVLFRKAYGPLLDVSLPKQETDHIRMLIEKHCSEGVSYHDLRTRKAGNFKYVDLHLNLPETLTVRQAHDICDEIENEIRAALRNVEVNIHVENF